LMALQFGKERPTGRLRLEFISRASAMPHKDHGAGAGAYSRHQSVDMSVVRVFETNGGLI
jgi:hypothetical protein